MALRARSPRTFTCGLLVVVAGCIVVCLSLAALIAMRHHDRFLPNQAFGEAWGEVPPRIACGSVTITAPSRETVQTTVNHGLGNVPVAVVLGLDLRGFDYYESIDSRPESGGGLPAEAPAHLSAMVRKPYNGTFTIRLKHFLGSQRTFTVVWLAISLEGPARAQVPADNASRP
ncbi:MAG TPA: hypothetical protein GX515_05390 [Firmicutes bacterium]|nr:hypothetical protein [Bacillota bacterium]